jgi:hypothetical protein
MVRRQCTREYKITPIRRQVRQLWQAAGQPPVEQWLGISLDEAHRMRTSDVAYITNAYPLVETHMTRKDCVRWLTAHGWTEVPKSACIGCPFRSDARWGAPLHLPSGVGRRGRLRPRHPRRPPPPVTGPLSCGDGGAPRGIRTPNRQIRSLGTPGNLTSSCKASAG